MKRYTCSNCGKKGLYKRKWDYKCVYCKHIVDSKSLSKLDLHHKKHIDTPSFIAPDDDLVKNNAPIKSKSKQRCESILQKTLRSIPNSWYTKLQVNQYAHTATVGDYLLLAQENNYIFECKELDVTKNKQFPFSRLSQLGNMKAFSKSIGKNLAYFVILLWYGNQNNSLMYIVPLTVIEAQIKLSNKKSINADEIKKEFNNYEVKLNCLDNYLKNVIC